MGQVYVWYLGKLDDYNAVADSMLELDSQRLNERVSISSASVTAGNALSITVANNGGAATHIVSLWVNHTQTSVDLYVTRGGTGTVNGASLCESMDCYGKVLNLKVVTELGNTATFSIAPASSVPNLRVTLTANPPTVVGKHDVGLTLLIFNNNTSYDGLYNLQIDSTIVNNISTDDIKVTYDGAGPINATLSLQNVASIPTLRSRETALFNWKYTINDAQPGSIFTFSGRYTSASPFVSSLVQVVTPFGRTQNDNVNNIINVLYYNASSTIINIVTSPNGTLVSSQGSLRMNYSSLQWVRRVPDTQTSNFAGWSYSQSVDKDWYLVFRVDVTNDGSENITLTKNTAIYMQELNGEDIRPFFIVSYNNATDTISTYADDSITLLAGHQNTVTLYFAVDNAGANPASSGSRQKMDHVGTFSAMLGLFGTKGGNQYAQIIPFQAFTAIN